MTISENLGTPIEITQSEFLLFRDLIHEYFGINLTNKKQTLLVTRMNKYMKGYGFSSYRQYFNFLQSDKTGAALGELVDRISTNHTYFNRESDHFDFYTHKALPSILNLPGVEGKKCLRIWCAASSTGEEPYMLAMKLKNFLGEEYSRWDAGVLATDISEKALSIARKGIYSDDKIKTLPKQLVSQFFKKLPDNNYEIVESLKSEITFRRFNLINNFPFRAKFHVIFCRNVMIYFDDKTRSELVEKMYHQLFPGGYLFIGHSETLSRFQSQFKFIKPALYQRPLI